MRTVFGWSYPPGCSGPPEDDAPCEVCGRDVDVCICPECPVCEEQGQTDCYMDHGLQLCPNQIKGLQALFDADCQERNYWRGVEESNG